MRLHRTRHANTHALTVRTLGAGLLFAFACLTVLPAATARAATSSPHGAYTEADQAAPSELCDACHAPHAAAKRDYLFRPTEEAAGQLSVCYTCHDGSGASTNIKSGADNSFSADLLSGHSVEETDTPDLTDVCSDCHSPHLDPDSRDSLPAQDVNGVELTSADNGWCLACHNAGADWYDVSHVDGDYDLLLLDPSRNTTGYMTDGTFPGYLDDDNNPHAAVTTATPVYADGDCLFCHASHRAPNEFDGLVSTYTSEDFTLCFDCHNGTVIGAEDIKQYYPTDVGGDAVQTSSTRYGHRTVTEGTLASGSALPCYDCHNPHGSATSKGLVVYTETSAGMTVAIGDDAGELNLGDTATEADIRAFCFTCHTTYGGSVGDTSSYGWDGSGYAIVDVSAEFEGIARTGGVLKVPDVTGHYLGDTASCLTCHGEMTAEGDVNIHAPGGGVSNGDMDCYLCHTVYESAMEWNGVSNTDSYHHVLGTSASDPGDSASAYPTASEDVYCLSCHVDHDLFNDDMAANLRPDLADTSPAVGAATDFPGGGTYGVCVGCHSVSRAKSAEQADDGISSAVPAITGSDFDASAHDYAAASSFGDGSSYSANCVKCHDDENDSSAYQTSADVFGTHYSQERRILSALGATLTEDVSEGNCYGCHSGVVAGSDHYGVASMSQAARRIETEFGLASYHPVDGDGTSATVECVNCHNAHEVSAGTPVSDPDNTYDLAAYSTDADRTAYCLTCHDGGAPTYEVSGTTYVPADVVVVDASADKSTYSAKGHWSSDAVSGNSASSIDTGEEVTCAECHDNHASNIEKLLGVYDAASSLNKIGTVTLTGNDNSVCQGCHQSASTSFSSGFVREAGTGYPVDGTWTGFTIYGASGFGIHRNDGDSNFVVWPSSGYVDGDCKNCHDVHGTQYTYDELVGRFDPSSANNDKYALCFECHDGSPAVSVIADYPVSAGGTDTSTTDRHGHRGDAGVAVPCYDCHNPHGSYSVGSDGAAGSGLMVVTMTDAITTVVFGDQAGEIDLSTAAGQRHFCLSCHTTNQTSPQGWNGTAYAVVGSGATVDGYSRTTDLKITQAGTAHTSPTASAGCLGSGGTPPCHADPHVPDGS